MPKGGAQDRAMFLKEISHQRLREYLSSLDQLSSRDGSMEALRDLLAFPGYLEIVRAYKEIPHRLEGYSLEAKEGDGDPGQELEDSLSLQDHGDPGSQGYPRGDPAGDQPYPGRLCSRRNLPSGWERS